MTVWERLTDAREPAVERIVETATEQSFTGLVGEADVGKTALLHAALARLAQDWMIVTLDLDGAWSPNRLAWRWARELARAVTGDVALSHLTALSPEMWPAGTRSALLRAFGATRPRGSRTRASRDGATRRWQARRAERADQGDSPTRWATTTTACHRPSGGTTCRGARLSRRRRDPLAAALPRPVLAQPPRACVRAPAGAEHRGWSRRGVSSGWPLADARPSLTRGVGRCHWSRHHPLPASPRADWRTSARDHRAAARNSCRHAGNK